MSLLIQREGVPEEPTLEFYDDGYYWFLHPFWERLAETTGQYIDLYGTARFAGAALETLTATIDDALALTQQQHAQWDVVIGWQIPERTPVLSTVERATLAALLHRLAALVALARQHDGALLFSGD